MQTGIVRAHIHEETSNRLTMESLPPVARYLANIEDHVGCTKGAGTGAHTPSSRIQSCRDGPSKVGRHGVQVVQTRVFHDANIRFGLVGEHERVAREVENSSSGGLLRPLHCESGKGEGAAHPSGAEAHAMTPSAQAQAAIEILDEVIAAARGAQWWRAATDMWFASRSRGRSGTVWEVRERRYDRADSHEDGG